MIAQRLQRRVRSGHRPGTYFTHQTGVAPLLPLKSTGVVKVCAGEAIAVGTEHEDKGACLR